MLRLLLRPFAPLLYVQISPYQVTIRHLGEGLEWSEPAEIAIAQQGPYRLSLGVGHEAAAVAGTGAAQLVRPFAHPRTLLGNWEAAEVLLRELIQRALSMRWLLLAPRLVLHPMGQPEGGFTDWELRAFEALGEAVGASEVRIWTGPALRDQELLHTAPAPCAQQLALF